MMPELQKFGFLTWLNTGGKDFRPAKPPAFTARIDDPATFTPPDWDRSAGDGRHADAGQQARRRCRRRRARRGRATSSTSCASSCRSPRKFFSITTYDPDDFMRIEVDKATLPAGCTLAKHPTYKAEFVRGHPVFADTVTCQLP